MLPVVSVTVLTINPSEVRMQSVDDCGAVQGKSINKALQYKNLAFLASFSSYFAPFFP